MQIWGINIRVSKNYAQYCFFSQCSSVIVFSIHWRRHSVASILYTRRIHRRGDWIYSTVASFSVIQAIVFFIQAVFTWGVNIFYSSKLFCDCHFLVIHWTTTYQIHPTTTTTTTHTHTIPQSQERSCISLEEVNNLWFCHLLRRMSDERHAASEEEKVEKWKYKDNLWPNMVSSSAVIELPPCSLK